MGKDSSIEWTHHTFNSWWGCQKVSPGCEHCYAETLSSRFGHGVWGPAKTTPRREFGEKHWAEPLAWNAAAAAAGERRRVFCASMADVFEDHPQLDYWRMRLWDLIEATPHLDWLLLTKRPENIRGMLPALWVHDPMPNIWFGTSCEDQRRADERTSELLKVPAKIRFLSCEPLLGPITLFDTSEGVLRGPAVIVSGGMTPGTPDSLPEGYDDSYSGIDWVITGSESGPGARPCDIAWVRSLRDQCVDTGVAFFWKQDAVKGHKVPTPELDGKRWIEFPGEG